MIKKILVFVPNLAAGGAEKVAVNLSNALANDNHKTYLMCIKRNFFNLKNLSKNLKLINLNKPSLFSSILSIIQFLFLNKNNLYVISFLNAPNLFFCLLKFIFRYKNIKIAITIHNCISESYKNSNLKGKIIILLLSYFCRYADKIICVSNYVKKDFVDNWNQKHTNIITIYNPAINKHEINTLSKKKNLFTEKYKTKNYKILLAVGRLTKQKNYKLLIHAFLKVSKKINKIILVILGAGEQKDELVKLTKNKNISKKIFFLNFQKNPYHYIKNSDLIVLSSDWEGLPTILIESLYLKKKIVSTNCKGGCAEVLKNGKYGYLTPMNNFNSLSEKIILALKSKKKKIDNKYLNNFVDNYVLKKYKSFIFEK